ncbi:phosphoribosylglycinamide synthetase [Dactylonectria macrodidyma]|uniref:Phosphoribosylglycinamide synthetase n=1 Tax=Dactylonectria macrodidyma TaxID=307937 RepID=A0A9P9FUD6_9HYPO|nr:phosphoribosylglycinamide synthetase [Dactylonectria macrodidyma]
MQRWHEASCLQPDIEVLPDRTPRCRSCDGAPHVAELVANRATASSVPLVPPDKPLGQMNLWWPRSVPYSAPWSPSGADKLGDETRAPPKAPGAAAETSPYSSTLQPSEFRLICLPAVDAHDCPLHLTLEVYDLEDCPEYETVSYTWAGEDRDGALCQPIYVGPFWDVLLQTKNCWEMLRFVRPWRGTRMLWVDAICIDQSNIPERNSQVANMGRIYSTCTRVIVYLGPDIAVPLHGRHPRRRRLHELESGTVTPFFPPQPGDKPGDSPVRPDAPPHRLSDLLGRRYFSRVWVIQELLLPQRVIMRVGDVDFWADPAMSAHFSSSVPGWNWERTHAAWVQHISQGASSVKNLGELLWLTSLSRATDPRDRVFGLLGIMPELSVLKAAPISDPNASPMPRGGLQADYSLSCQHVFIGLFAYCLINMRQPNILYHASCLHSNVLNYPSWAPNWTSRTTWRLLFMSPKIGRQEVFSELRRMIKQAHSNDDFIQRDMEPFNMYELNGPAEPHIAAERSWHQGAHIDTLSGALRINLTHYMAISQPLERIGRISGFFVFAMRAEPFTTYLLSEHTLDTIITGSDNEQLFVLNIDDRSMMYLVLRPTSNINDRTFNLISTCPFVLIKMPSLRRENEIPTLRALGLKDLQHSLYDVIQEVHGMLDRDIFVPRWSNDHTLGHFPGVKTYRGILPVLMSLHAEEHEGGGELTDAFTSAYLGCINPQYSPRINDGYVEMTIYSHRGKIWNVYFQETSWLDRQFLEEHPWEYRVKGGDSWAYTAVSSSTYKKLQMSGWAQGIDVRFPVARVRKELTGGVNTWGILEAMDRLLHTSKQTGEDLWLMLTEAPKDDDRFIGCPSGRSVGNVRFSELWDKLEVVGSTSIVIGIPCIGPTKSAALLETSKAFAKEFMRRHGIPSADYGLFSSHHETLQFVKNAIENGTNQLVIKYQGLTGGRNVFVGNSLEEAEAVLEKYFPLDTESRSEKAFILVEHFLEGEEFSIIALTDGTTSLMFPPYLDFKRRQDRDQGPSTGGMGCICPTQRCPDALLQVIQKSFVKRTLGVMRQEDLGFASFIAIDTIITKDGPMAIEYDVRLSDPETQALMSLISPDVDLAASLKDCSLQQLSPLSLSFEKLHAVVVVAVAKTYPHCSAKLIPNVNISSHFPSGKNSTPTCILDC